MELEQPIIAVQEFLLSKKLITEEQAKEFNRNWERLKEHLANK